MGSIAKQKLSAEFTPLDEGTHLAICNAVIDIGLQSTPFGVQEHVWLRFEVPAERISFIKNGEEIDAGQIIWSRYNKTLTKKANLRKDLEAWFGREFTSDELDGFDLFNLSGMPCLLTVVHNHKDDRTFANVTAIAKILKGQVVPPMEQDAIQFSPDDTDSYDDVPEWLREKFDDRLEPPTPVKRSVEMVETEQVSESDFHDDDIPF